MSTSSSLPTDTADAKQAKKAAKRRRKAAQAEARAEQRRKRRAAAEQGSTPVGETTGSAPGSVPELSRFGALRARIADLWERRIFPVLDVVSPIGWAVLGMAVSAVGVTLVLRSRSAAAARLAAR